MTHPYWTLEETLGVTWGGRREQAFRPMWSKPVQFVSCSNSTVSKYSLPPGKAVRRRMELIVELSSDYSCQHHSYEGLLGNSKQSQGERLWVEDINHRKEAKGNSQENYPCREDTDQIVAAWLDGLVFIQFTAINENFIQTQVLMLMNPCTCSFKAAGFAIHVISQRSMKSAVRVSGLTFQKFYSCTYQSAGFGYRVCWTWTTNVQNLRPSS